MAYSTEGFLGDFSGQLGNLVVYKMYGKTVMRTRPAGRRGPASPSLRAAQNDFSRVMQVMRRLKEYLRTGFYDVAQKRSAYHQALSENLLRYRASAKSDSMDWLLVSRGHRANARDIACTFKEKEVEVTWGEPQQGKPWAAHDQAMLVAINTTTLDVAWEQSAGVRAQGRGKVYLPAASAGEQVRVFISFRCALPTGRDQDPSNVSDSMPAN